MNNPSGEWAVLFVGDAVPESRLRRRTDYSIVVESTVAGARDRVREADVACIVTEYRLPEGDGAELVESVRRDYPELPVILWAAAGDERVASDAITAGVTEYLVRDETTRDRERELDRLMERIEELVGDGRVRVAGTTAGETERRFRAVFAEAFDAMLIADDDAEYVDVNPAACELFGLSREELLGRSIEEFAAEGYDFEAVWQEFQESDGDRGTFPLVRADGETRLVEFAATPDVLPGRHLSVLRDITDRRNLEQQSREERDRARQYLDTAGVLMVALDTNGEVTLANQRACEVLGRDEADIVGSEWFDAFVPESDRAETRAGFNRLIAGEIEPVEQFENWVVAADGERRLIEWHNTVLRDGAGDIIGTLSSGTDVTERERFETMLTGLYDSTRELFDAETVDEVSETVVETVTDVLGIPSVVMYRYDEREERLDPAAQAAETGFMREELPSIPPDDSSLTGHVYGTGDVRRFDDVTESPYLRASDTEMRAGIFAPVGDYGVLVVGSDAVGAFDERLSRLVELLAANAAAACDRVERQAALKRSETRLSLALDAATAGVWEWNVQTDDVIWSASLERLFGLEPGTFEGTYEGFANRIHPDDRSAVEDELQRALDRTGRFESEFRIVRNDGETRWVDGQGEVFVDEAGDPVRVIGVDIDVTDHRDRERQLELFRDLVDHSSDGIAVLDPETGDLLDVNEACCRMLDYSRSELLSRSVFDIDPEFSRERWDDSVESVHENGENVLESTHQRRDGSTFPVEIKTSLVSLDSEYLVAAVRDITERRERERALEDEKERFQALIEAAPDPIFVADAETGEIVEANSAACRIRGQPRDEIVGLHQSALHPEGEEARYRALFERHLAQNGTITRFDGEQVYLASSGGDRIPVSISARTVHLDEQTLIHGIFRDVSDQKRYRDSLEQLDRAARNFIEAETDHEVAQMTVDVAADVLELSGTAVYLYDTADGVLMPAAHSQSLEETIGTPPVFSPGSSVAWRAYATQEQAVFDDVRSADAVYNPGTPIRSELVVPLGEHGVFLATSTEIGVFDDLTVELAEVLTATAEAALDHVERARQLQEQKRESQRRAQRLERVNQLTENIQSIIRAVVDADTRGEIQQTVCDRLVDLDGVTFAWVGEPDYVREALTPEAWAGPTHGYLEALGLDLDAENGPPAVRAARQHRSATVSNIAEAVQRESWRRDALRFDLRAAISVPLVYDGLLHGVLSLYAPRPATFDDRSASVLTELGELIGYALDTVDRQDDSSATKLVELTFEIADSVGAFGDLAGRFDAELEIRNIIVRSDETYLAQVLVQDVDPDRFEDVTGGFLGIDDVRTISPGNPALFELVVSESRVVTAIATVGVTSSVIAVGQRGSQLTVTVSQNREIRPIIEQIRDRFSEVEFVGRQTVAHDAPPRVSAALDQLTDRQREVLRAAYYGGFFERPRRSTGSEIADALGISQPSFSKQLRRCQKNLLEPIYEPE